MLLGVFPLSASSLPVPSGRAQVALETLIVTAGLLAFFAAFFAATQPLRDSAFSKTAELQEKAAFERVKFAVFAASASSIGSSFSVEFALPSNVSISWNATALRWEGMAAKEEADAVLFKSGSFVLPPGSHSLVATRWDAVVLEWT